MLFKLLWALVKATLAAIFWAAILALVHRLGWYPDEQIAGLFVMAPTPSELWIAFLGLVALLAIALLFAEHWISPLIVRIRKGKPPLEIIFDPTNPSNRFWERTSPRDENGNKLPGLVWEYRVKIQNTSSKTVRNVRISRESSGLIPELPSDLIFQKDGKQTRDLQPNGSEYVAVLRKFPPQAGDAWGETAKAFHGPIKIIASGDDIPQTECEFDYYPDQIPAIVQRGPLQ